MHGILRKAGQIAANAGPILRPRTAAHAPIAMASRQVHKYSGDTISYENPVLWAGEPPVDGMPNARQMAEDYARETGASHLHNTPIGFVAEHEVENIQKSSLSDGDKQKAIDEIWEIACSTFVDRVSGEATIILKNPIQGNAYHRFEERLLKMNPKIHTITVIDLSTPKK